MYVKERFQRHVPSCLLGLVSGLSITLFLCDSLGRLHLLGTDGGHGNISNSPVGYVRSSYVYGHVHIGKTGGSELNGELAMHFERVCGHKGYSYDAFQANKRFNETSHHDYRKVPDMYSKIAGGFNRGRVLDHWMQEIGFEDCDWISFEASASIWQQFESFHLPMQLHVPCRDPINHLMSQCNQKEMSFDCDADDVIQQVRTCLVNGVVYRYSNKLQTYKNIDVKCFDFKVSFTKYLDLMANTLQRKVKETDYVHRNTNRPRNKSNECIWRDEALQRKVKEYLITNQAYYIFCDKCIGSERDLFAIDG